MKKNGKLLYLIPVSVFIVCVLIVILLTFCSKRFNNAPFDTSLSGTEGTPISSVSITDLQKMNVVNSVNYTPNKFLIPNSEISGTPVNLSENNKFAQKGTFIFVFKNLDPFSENFIEQSNKLSPYLEGDGYWHFNLYIPIVWSACNVYVDYVLVGRSGEISNYNYINYSNYVHETLQHSDGTQPIFIDLPFYTRQSTISADPLDAATVVTIHYEAASPSYSGIKKLPLVGEKETINYFTSNDKILSTILYLVAALITAIFIFVCILKKTLSFLSHLGIVFGIFGMMLSSFILTTATAFPHFWFTLRNFMLAFTLLSGLHSLKCKNCLFPVWLGFTVMIAAYCLTIPLFVIIPVDFSAWEYTYKLTATIIGSCAILFFTCLCAGKTVVDPLYLVNPILVSIIGISACIPNTNIFAYLNPMYWICAITLIFTAMLGGRIFILQERRLNYLTKNLLSEVDLQTREMKNMVRERDELLRYVSHDMKKPVASMEHFICVLKQRETDAELKKLADIIARKANELSRSLTELASYSKNNFTAEESTTFDLDEIFEKIGENLGPDCNAYGIIFKIMPCNISVYAKPKNLYSVINNIIMNAIEHSECKHIWLSAQKKKHTCYISISDDGKGVDENTDLFRPYYSGSKSEKNTGLGLYLSKNFMLSMNGDLTFRQENGKLTFTLSLPLA